MKTIIKLSDCQLIFAVLTLNFGFWTLNSSAQLSQGSFTIGGANDERAWSIVQTTDGGYAIAGWTDSYGTGGNDFYVIKLDNAGVLAWTKTIGGLGNLWNWTHIIQTTDGGYAMTGFTSSYGAGDNDVYVVKLDFAGVLQWTKTIGGAGNDRGYSIIQTTDGGYTVAGMTDSYGAGGWDVYVLKLDNSGALQWTKTIGGPGIDVGFSIIQTTDGGYAVAGYTYSYGAGGADVYVLKLDNSGALQWTKTIGGANTDHGSSIIQTTDGGYAIGGITVSYGAGSADFYVLKLDNAGALQWTKTIGGTGLDQGYYIIQTTDGGYAITGFTASYGAGSYDVYLVKLDPAGILQWTKTIGGPGIDVGFSIIQTTDGGYAVAGSTTSYGAGGWDVYMLKFDAGGNICVPTGGGGFAGSGGTTNSGGITSNGGTTGSGGIAGNGGIYASQCTTTTTFLVNVTAVNVSCNGSCTGTATSIPSGGTSPYTYNWSNGQTTQIITGLCAGTYTVTVTGAATGTAIATVTIAQPTALTATVTSTSAVCGGSNGSATINAGGGTPGYTYSWNPAIAGQTTQTATGLGAGNYTATVTDVNGCTATQTVTVVSSGSISTGQSVSICSGSTYTLPGGTVVTTGGIYNDTLTSVAGCDSIITTALTVDSVFTTIQSASICTGSTYTLPGGTVVSTGGVYIDTLTSVGGCDSVITTTLTVYSVLTSNQSASICAGSTYTLPGGTIASTGGIYNDTLVSTGGCDSIITTTLTVNPNPTVNAFSNVTITQGQSVTLTASGGGTYNWSNGANGSSITVTPLVTTIYCVTVTDANNCTDMACVTVTIEPIDCSTAGELYLPTAFSPNNDGENDVLQIYYGNALCIKTLHLVIYDRWGEAVFETTSVSDAWNGKYKSKIMHTEVLVYRLNATMIDGKEIIRRGNISLVR